MINNLISKNYVNNHNILLILEGIIVGTIVFGVIYGFGPLDVTNDRWIMSGYDESDIIQHYAGWCSFRSSQWHVPLGLADNMGGGTFISYTDSLPWLAVIFKFILQVIHYDGNFQYFGLYGYFCYVLQAIAAGLLIRRRTSNNYVICICMWLLCFSPILMEKSLRHTGLGSHWLVLLAMYAYLKFRDRKCTKFPLTFGVLAVFAVGIHPYFLPLVLVFSFLSLLSSFYRKTNIVRNSAGFVFSILLPLVAGYMLGALGTGVNISRGGFGYWTMNLNAIFNPVSLGGYVWSSFLKVHPLTLGNLNENTYMGFGYLCLVFLAVLSFIFIPPKWNKLKAPDTLTYIVIAIFMTAFAVTNVVVFNDKILFKIPVPEKILYLCGIFRASPRMFYFTYYSLVIFSIYRLYDVITNLNFVDRRTKQANALLVPRAMTVYLTILIIFTLQFIDVSQAVGKKHADMNEKLYYQSIIDDQNLADAVRGKHYLIANNSTIPFIVYNRSLSVFTGMHNISTSYSIANSGDYSASIAKGNNIMNDFLLGKHSDDLIVAYHDIEAAKKLYQSEQIRSSNQYIESSGFAFIIADKDTRNLARNPDDFIASSFSDENFDRGISRSNDAVLFIYSDELLDKLNSGYKHIVDMHGNETAITGYDSIGKISIKVTIDGDAKKYAFPGVVRFKI